MLCKEEWQVQSNGFGTVHVCGLLKAHPGRHRCRKRDCRVRWPRKETR